MSHSISLRTLTKSTQVEQREPASNDASSPANHEHFSTTTMAPTANSTAKNTAPKPQLLDVTVVIPTYNGAKRLPALLDKLRLQITPENRSWEIIVCDNNSLDDTGEVVRTYQADWPSHVPLRYSFGAQQGAAFARQHAVESAHGKLIAFLDDDNLPADNWVEQAFQFAQKHPQAGAFGSQIHGQFESELPDELENIKTFLAIIERGDQPQRYEPAQKILPPAAGLVVRRQAWLNNVPERLFLNNTSKSAGLASEDLEAILHIQKAGWDVWYNPDMVVHHDIPDGRLRQDYLVSLFRCVGLSCFHIRMLRVEPWKKPFAVPAHIANDIRKLALHRMRYGERKRLNIVENCRREQLSTTVKSPFFLLKKAYNDKIQDQQDKRHPEQKQRLQQLTQAFEQEEFALYQQPVVTLSQATQGDDTSTPESSSPHNIRQNELLLRLRDEQNNPVLPSFFLPTAKRYGLMRTLDRQVIRQLFKWVKQQANAATLNHTLYAINLSQDSVEDPTLADFVAQKLSKLNLPPSLFCFEIPTAAALTSPSSTVQLTKVLHALGCQVTLDDVTINRSTANLITQMPVDYVKLTPAMVKTIRTDRSPWTVLSKLIQEHPVQAIAKGIESQATLEAMKQQGIRYAQGYQTGRPMPLDMS
ncbi:MAG: hormogonium polysaccharide biosynthesis glycosyltransferase HpsE [Cyanobacteria bacterium P01_F01_bin.53]